MFSNEVGHMSKYAFNRLSGFFLFNLIINYTFMIIFVANFAIIFALGPF
jgi:hypothetical protein